MCHEVISWEPSKESPKEEKEEEDSCTSVEANRLGACRCSSVAWLRSEYGYDYFPSADRIEEHAEGRRAMARLLGIVTPEETTTVTAREALGLIARDWGRRALFWFASALIVAGLLVAFFVWGHELRVFLVRRPSRMELLLWCYVIFSATRLNLEWKSRDREQQATYRDIRRERALKAAWAALRGPRPTTPSDVAASRGQA
jgi:hypothetical protein